MLNIMASGWESIAQLFTVLLIFVFVLIITYLTTRFIGNYQKTQITKGNIQVIETYKITSNKFIQVVKIGEKYMAIAISKENITMLTELNEDSLTLPEQDMMNQEGFKELLERAKNILPKK